jgi:hypothetical protein
MVDHAEASQRNKDKISAAYAAQKLQQSASSGSGSAAKKAAKTGGSVLGKRKG